MDIESNDLSVLDIVSNVVKRAQMIRKCHVCETVLTEDSQFCEECGSSIATKCNTCGKDIVQGKKYCRYCGTGL